MNGDRDAPPRPRSWWLTPQEEFPGSTPSDISGATRSLRQTERSAKLLTRATTVILVGGWIALSAIQFLGRVPSGFAWAAVQDYSWAAISTVTATWIVFGLGSTLVSYLAHDGAARIALRGHPEALEIHQHRHAEVACCVFSVVLGVLTLFYILISPV